MSTQLQSELDYFIAHQDELVQQYRGKILVIKDEAVIGVYDSLLDAYLQTQKEHALGTFMLQRCEPGPDAYTVSISSRGIFASSA